MCVALFSQSFLNCLFWSFPLLVASFSLWNLLLFPKPPPLLWPFCLWLLSWVSCLIQSNLSVAAPRKNINLLPNSSSLLLSPLPRSGRAWWPVTIIEVSDLYAGWEGPFFHVLTASLPSVFLASLSEIGWLFLYVCHRVFNYSKGCGHHTQDRAGLTPHGSQSLDSHHVICVQQSLLAYAQFHSVYRTCQPARK